MKYLILLALINIAQASTHVIGNSHVRAFEGISDCIIHDLGPILMHRVGRDAKSILDLNQLGIQEGETVVYVFGEIDVRCHVIKQRDLKQRKIEEILQTLVQNYIATILLNQSQYERIKGIVYNVVPPAQGGSYNLEYPVHGSIEERIMATKQLNAALCQVCREHGLAFLDIYDIYACEDGSLDEDFSDGNVHIDAKYNIPIQAKLFDLIRAESHR